MWVINIVRTRGRSQLFPLEPESYGTRLDSQLSMSDRKTQENDNVEGCFLFLVSLCVDFWPDIGRLRPGWLHRGMPTTNLRSTRAS